MTRITQSATVTIHYQLTVDGAVMDSTLEDQPVTYVHGEGRLIPGLEEKLEGFRAGDKVRIVVTPEKAYGPYRPENLHEIDRAIFTDPDEIEVGTLVEGRNRLGAPFRAKIVEAREDAFVVDLNHPLAGKYLEFEVEVVSVEAPGPEP